MKKFIDHIIAPIKDFLVHNFKVLKIKYLARKKPVRIIIGAGETIQKNWISTEMRELNLLNENDWKRLFPKKNIDAIMAEHVWEHLTKEDGITAAKMCFKYLKLGGYARIAVPDGFNPDDEYISRVKPNGNGPGAKDHKVLYTYKSLQEVFESAGFNVKLLEYFDENGKFFSNKWDPEQGLIARSSIFDKRNKAGKLNYTSIILDAKK